MGRFFKTSSPQNLDFMYKLPQELMLKATQQTSEDITQNQVGLLSLADTLKASAIDQDMPRAKEIIAEKEAKIAELSKVLQENPLEFRRKSGDIIGLGREIQKEWTLGEMSAIQSRYGQRAAWVKQQEDLLKAGRIKNARAVELMLAENDRNTAALGYNAATGSHNKWAGEQLTSEVDPLTELMKIGKEIRSHIKAGANAYSDGKYIHDWSKKTDTLSKAEIAGILRGSVMTNDDMMNYLKQRTRIGEIDGFFDKNGNFIDPIVQTGTRIDEKTKKEVPVYGIDTRTKLGQLINTVADTYDKDDVLSYKVGMKDDGRGTAEYAQSLKSLASATPDSWNNPMTQRGTLASMKEYTEKINAPQTTLTAATGYIIAGANASLAKSGKTEAQMNSELKNLEVSLATAKKEAEAGDPTKLLALYQNYAPASEVGLANLKYVRNGLYTLKDDQTEAEILTNQLTSLRSLVKQKNPNLTQIQIEEEVDRIVKDPKYNTNTTDLLATSGNNSNLWPDPALRNMAVKEWKGVEKLVANPTMWGAGENHTFYVSIPDDNGNMQQFEMNLQQARKKFMNLSTQNKKVFEDVSNKTEEEINAMAASGEESIETGRMTNKVGTAQVMPLSMRFNYYDLNNNPQVKDDAKWIVRIPFIASEDGKVGYVMVDGSNINSEAFAGLKSIADQSSSVQNTIQMTQNAFSTVKNYAKDNDISLHGDDHWNINTGDGTVYNTEIDEILKK